MSFEKKLEELFVELPETPRPPHGVVPAVQEGKILYVGQCLPFSAGKIVHKGRVGIEVSLDQARMAARHALLIGLSAIRGEMGSLNKVRQFVQMTGFVAGGGEFQEHDRVLDQASKLLTDIFGNAGKHTRVAVGVNQLPQNACVSLSLIVAVQ
ncbi:MAG: RidA family protein [Deltaproteobacteria bacterium]|nr:RidA family protein [Deltaproteobacteria bacterium]